MCGPCTNMMYITKVQETPLVQETPKSVVRHKVRSIENILLWFSGSNSAFLVLIFNTFVIKIFETIIH